MVDSLQSEHVTTDHALKLSQNFFPQHSPETIIIPITESEIVCTINSMNNKNLSGLMTAPINYYYLVLSILVNLLLIFKCSDSGAAIAAFAKTNTEWALVWEGMQVLEELSGSH